MPDQETPGSSATVDELWDRLEQTQAEDAVAFTVLSAIAGDADLRAQIGGEHIVERPEKTVVDAPNPVLAYVRAINVEGFRGIGPAATLELNARPGLTVVSGRNGSGKSSFAEAFEYAVTGDTYRWNERKKTNKTWKSEWRNLHRGKPCRIGVELIQEPGEAAGSAQRVLIGAQWEADAGLEDAQTWSRVAGGDKQSVAELGWSRPVELYRPILSYDEIGGLFEDRQSALYDALNKILGLDEITDGTARITAAIREVGEERKRANALRTALRKTLTAADDPRAAVVNKALARAPYKIGDVEEQIAGTGSPQHQLISALRACADSTLVDRDTVDRTVAEYRAALAKKHGAADAALTLVATRTALLREAQEYVVAAVTEDCPVCETPLPEGWAAHVAETIAANEKAVTEHGKDVEEWTRAREQLMEVVASLPTFGELQVDGAVRYADAVAALRVLPDEQTAVAEHVTTGWAAVAEAHASLTVAAAGRVDEVTDAWAPLVQEIATWLSAEKAARVSDSALDQLNSAKKWLNDNSSQLRAQRMRPIVDAARDIWSKLRQESDVDLGAIELLGSGNQRHVSLTGSVDGEDTGVLSVMSQGELHALALALFIPRATVGESPFGFLFLDDPIQAMDPAKIDGFLSVLQEIAKTRQVVVFSHDDRLPTAIRRLSVDATLLEVSREPGSTITVKDAEVTAQRYAADAFSLIRDDGVPAHVKNAAGPGLFRLAVESAAKQCYFHDRARSGASYVDAEEQWSELKTTKACVAVALGRDPSESLGGWQSRHSFPHRDNVMAICTAGVHGGSVLDVNDVSDLRRVVRDLLGQK